MLNRALQRLEKEFVEQGGIKERMPPLEPVTGKHRTRNWSTLDKR